MVRLFHSLRDLDVSKLLNVYSKSMEESISHTYPKLDPHEGYLYARQDFYQYLGEVFFRTQGAFYAVFEECGCYVSALRIEPYRDGVLLAAVETVPEMRRKGYAGKLIRGVIEYCCEHEIRKIYAHISKKNAPSIALHSSCGFSRISEVAVYIDGTVSDRACTFCCDVDGK